MSTLGHCTNIIAFIAAMIIPSYVDLENIEDPIDEECSTEILLNQRLKTDPAFKVKHFALENERIRYLESEIESSTRMDYILPIVVHVVHDNGPENVGDNVVVTAIEWLNDAFSNTKFYDRGNGVDTRIQFCLAKRDPQGQATTGITRTVSSETNVGTDASLKAVSRWDTRKYINIWVVRNIGGSIAGYSTLPASHGELYDGIVVYSKVMETGARHSTLVHELGHYLGLYHTFSGTCQNDNCLIDGDKVCDTPPDQSTAPPPSCTQGVNSCSTDANSGLSSDMDDLTWNYVDYGNHSCRSGYTQGQSDRMAYFIDNVRWSLINTLACEDPCPTPYSAAFTSSAKNVGLGDQVMFTNTSTGGNTHRWFVDGTLEATSQNFNHTFDFGSGSYEVVLEEDNGNANCLEIFKDTIHVNCPAEANFTTSKFKTIVGSQVDFVNTSINSGSFAWYVNGVLQSNMANFSSTFAVNGSHEVTLKVEDPTGKCQHEKSVFIKVQCAVVAFSISDTFPEPGSTIQFTNLSEGGQSISWTVNGQPQGSSTILSYLFDNPGVYTVCLRVENGTCFDETCTKVFVFENELAECEEAFITALGTSKEEVGRAVTFVEIDKLLIASSQDNDVGITLLSDEGEVLWNRRFNPSPGVEYVHEMIYEGKGLVVVSGYSEAVGSSGRLPFIFKYDYVKNQILWFNQVNYSGSRDSYVQGLLKHPNNGNYFIYGQLKGGITFGGDGVLIEINGNNGEFIWTKTYELGSDETFLHAQLQGNFIYLVGRHNYARSGKRTLRSSITKVDLLGNQIWSRLYLVEVDNTARSYAYGVTVNQNSIVVAGYIDIDGISATDVELHLFETDLDGNIVWANVCNIQGVHTERVVDVFEVTNGYLTFGFYIKPDGKRDILLIHYDKQGNILSSKAFGKSGYHTEIYSVNFNNGKFHLIGTTDAFGTGESDILIMKINTAGEVIDANCDFEVPINITWKSIDTPYDGFHTLIEIPFSLSDNFRSFSPADASIERTELCFEPCLKDTCFNGAITDSVPDALLSDVGIFCNGSGFTVSLEICNTDSVTLENSLPIAFYESDPVSTNAILIDVFYTSSAIDSGECKTFSFDVGPNNLNEIYIVVNDMGAIGRPFNITEFKPGTQVLECNYTNNIGYIQIPKSGQQLDIGPDLNICPFEAIDLDAGLGFASYLWSTLESTPVITVWKVGTYFVEVTDNCGLVLYDTINIALDNSTMLDIGQDTVTFCPSEVRELDIPGYTEYRWTPSGQVSCDTCPKIELTPDSSMTLWLTTKTARGCILRDSVYLNILPQTEVSDTIEFCEGDTAFYKNDTIFEEGAYNVFLENKIGCDTLLYLTAIFGTDTISNNEVAFICEGDSIFYENTWITEEGDYLFFDGSQECVKKTDLEVRYFEMPDFEIVRGDISCYGEEDGEIIIQTTQEQFRFILKNDPSVVGPIFSNLSAGEYIIQVIDTTSGCMYLDTIDLSQPGEVQITLPKDTSIEYGSTVKIVSNILPLDGEVVWTPNIDLDCDTCVVVESSTDTSRWYYATVTDSNGCRAIDSIFIRVIFTDDIFIPNVFSPDGDGNNDFFFPFTKGVTEINKLLIYDRWGELIFKRENMTPNQPSQGWDGTFNGELLDPAVFVYHIELTLRNNQEVSKSGDLTLIR